MPPMRPSAWWLALSFPFIATSCRTGAAPAPTRSAAVASPSSDAGKLATLIARAGAASEELTSADGRLVIVPAWGARVMGVLFDDDNALWVSPQAADPHEWNKGGARTWIAPEGHEKGFFFDATWTQEGWRCPPALDPGHYVAVPPSAPGARAFRNELELVSNDGTKYKLAITREIAPAANPLGIDPASAGVRYAGFSITQKLQNRGSVPIDREIDLWNMVMAKPPATMVIPVATDADGPKWRDDYFEPIPAGYLHDGGDYLALKIAGPPRYKIGVPAARCRGLTGSIGPLPDGKTWQLIVDRFPCEPRGRYVERPKTAEDNGDPIQGYSHSKSGEQAFYEIESHAPAVRLLPGAEQVEPVEVFVFRGPEGAIRVAAGKLLGVDGGKLHVF